MERVDNEGPKRILTEQQITNLKSDVFETARTKETWSDAVNADPQVVEAFLDRGIAMIQSFEEATYQRHPEVSTDTDVIYIDSGPGPYSYTLLPAGKSELEDTNYHAFPWSRKMDRARIRVAYTLARMITAKRIEEQTGKKKKPSELASQDFENFAPYLQYTSTPWQNAHIASDVIPALREKGVSEIPDSKIVMYDEFTTADGERQKISHTEDQIEGLRFPERPNGFPPRRVVIVSHPAHLMRILHILGKYPDRIPKGTVLQLFPVPTPVDGVIEYAKAELLGTLATVFKKNRATLTYYNQYQL